MSDTEQIVIRTFAPHTAEPTLTDERVELRAVTPEEIEQRRYTSELAAELAVFKATLDALIAAPNSAVAREVKDFARATRSMFRAAVRDVRSMEVEA